MIGLEKDNAFFTVESDDINLVTRDYSKSLISLSITEKMDGMPQGTLTFVDDNHMLSHILRTGVKVKLSWGYKSYTDTPESLYIKTKNLDEVSGTLIRRGLEGFVSSPSGGGSQNGMITYNCNFTAYGFRGEDQAKLYTDGNKKTVIDRAFDDLGISATKRYIDFVRGTETVTTSKGVRQDESTYRFLTRLAREWRALFFVTFDQSGGAVGVFIDPDKIVNNNIPKWVAGAKGGSHLIGYKGTVSNVISYKWSTGESESGVGDNAQIDIVDGQIVYRRYSAAAEKVISYKLRPDKIQQVFESATDIGQQTRILGDMLKVNDFEQIKHYFEPIETSTAPNGYGYRISLEMLGNPLMIPPNIVKINNGFPTRFGDYEGRVDTNFYVSQVTHKIDNSGYKMSVEVVDAFAVNPLGAGLL